jgi:hypothetical protein
MDEQVQEQASDELGDVPASEQEGHEVPFIPQKEDKKEQAEKRTVSNEEAKDWRKSDKEWQKMKEKTEEFESFKTKLAENLGVKPEQVEAETDLLDKLQQQMAKLQQENERTKWESKHPVVNREDYQEEWSKICKEKGHLVTQGELTYDDLWRLVRKDGKPSSTPKDYREQERSEGSIPVASKTPIVSDDIDPDVLSWMRQKYPQLTDDQIRSLGK